MITGDAGGRGEGRAHAGLAEMCSSGLEDSTKSPKPIWPELGINPDGYFGSAGSDKEQYHVQALLAPSR